MSCRGVGCAIVLSMCSACVELIVPSPVPPTLDVSLLVVDSLEIRGELAAVFEPGRSTDGSPRTVTDPSWRIGELVLLPIPPIEGQRLVYHRTVSGGEAEALLSLAPGDSRFPSVEVHASPSDFVFHTIRRSGGRELTWSESEDLVLGTERFAESGDEVNGEWTVTIHHVSEASTRVLTRVSSHGHPPAVLSLDRSLIGTCIPGEHLIELRFLLRSPGSTGPEGYVVTGISMGRIWWRAVREC